jgi:hypothetical protein
MNYKYNNDNNNNVYFYMKNKRWLLINIIDNHLYNNGKYTTTMSLFYAIVGASILKTFEVVW